MLHLHDNYRRCLTSKVYWTTHFLKGIRHILNTSFCRNNSSYYNNSWQWNRCFINNYFKKYLNKNQLEADLETPPPLVSQAPSSGVCDPRLICYFLSLLYAWFSMSFCKGFLNNLVCKCNGHIRCTLLKWRSSCLFSITILFKGVIIKHYWQLYRREKKAYLYYGKTREKWWIIQHV